MQNDCTIFRIPNLPITSANNFGIQKTETVKVDEMVTGEVNIKPVESNFKYYEELNNIAEELEKCRLRML